MRFAEVVVRNRLTLVVSVVLLLAVATAGISVWKARIATAEKQRAETASALIRSIFEAAASNAGGKELSAVDLLLRAERELRSRPIPDPGVRAEVAATLARSLFSLDEDVVSERLASQALEEARKALPADDPAVLRLAVLRAEQKHRKGDSAEALSLVNDALAHFAGASQKLGDDSVRALIVRADVLITTKGDDAAVDAARSAARIARSVAGPNDPLTVRATSVLGRALDRAGHAEESVDVTHEALQLTRRLADRNERDPRVIAARTAYAKALGDVSRYDLASDELEAAIRDATTTYGAESVEVSSLRQNVAVYQLKAGRLREGLYSLSRMMDLGTGVPADSPTHSLTSRSEYAQGLMLSRRAAEALPVLASIQQGMAAAFGPLDVRTLEAGANYALALAWTGSLEAAAGAADEAIANASRKRAEATHLPWHARATIFRLQGNAPAAVEQEAMALKKMADNATPAERAEVLVELGTAQLLAGDPVSAERNLVESMEQLDAAHHAKTPVRADAQARLARLRLSQTRAADALPLAQQADEFWRDFDAGNRAAAEAALWLGRTRLALGEPQQASEPLQRARKLLAGSRLPSDAELLRLASAAASRPPGE